MITLTRLPASRHFKTSACAAVLLALSACGGGGGGSGDDGSTTASPSAPTAMATERAAVLDRSTTPPSVPATAPIMLESTPVTLLSAPEASSGPASTAPGKLLISEVATNYYLNDVAWFEVHNPAGEAVLLSDYTLHSSAVDTNTGMWTAAPAAFALPAVSVPPKGYLVIASKPVEKLQNTGQMVHVRNGTVQPYWNASGSIELVKAGRTSDFVRFGSSMAAPTTSGEWMGASVAPLPSGAQEHGKSIVRLASRGMADTNVAGDWTQVNFATPAGLNDVPSGVVDSDRDGIPDSAKVQGGTYAGMDLYAMGARPGRRDAFIEIDYMKGSDPALAPRYEALKKMVDTFAAKNIALHFDTGSLYSPIFNPSMFNLGGGNPVDFSKCIELDMGPEGAKQGCAAFYDYKTRHFDVRRKLMFHYALFANSFNLDGSAGSSGVAELNGNDLIVTLGGYGLSATTETNRNLLVNLQAGTLMHEFGHNLGLLHGGNEDTNYKPNHYSIMNYMYQFAGLSATPNTVHAAERYYLANGLKGKTYCNLVENSPCTSNFIMSYSNGTSADLDERSLSEAMNIGRGSINDAFADWDNNNTWTRTVISRNLNSRYDTVTSVLKDYDEWSNLTLAFSRSYHGSNSGVTMKSADDQPRVNPMNHRPSRLIEENPLPARLQEMLRNPHADHH